MEAKPSLHVERLGAVLLRLRLDDEGLHARRDERVDRLADDEVDEVVVRVIATSALAREDVWLDANLFAVFRQSAFEQPLVDRPELLNAEVTIVDVSSPRGRLLERQNVGDFRHHRVVQTDLGQKRRAGRIEQPSIVGRQPDRGVAVVDRPAKLFDDGPIAGGRRREGVILILAAAHFGADLLAEAIGLVPSVVDRQQAAVLGVKNEQQAVEKDQRGVAHVLQRRRRRGCGDGLRERRKDKAENLVRQVAGDPLLVKAALIERDLVERPLLAARGEESLASEHEREDPKPMRARLLVEREQASVVARHADD